MSSFLCFICHNAINGDTNGDTRVKYKELLGMKLCSDAHLCQICCHLLNKLWRFKSICLRRSMEYPILYNDKGTLNLQNSNIETINLCPDSEECELQSHINYNFTFDENIDSNIYVSLEDKTDIENTEIQKDDDDNKSVNNDEFDNVIPEFDDTFDNGQDTKSAEENESTDTNIKQDEINKNNDFNKIILTVEEQKAELEAKRREDKYLEAEFKCYNCAMGFLFKDTYQAHMMRHEESNGEHLCPICLLRFAAAGVLRAHVSAHRERLACARCGRAVRPRRRRAHRARCHPPQGGAPAMCHRCSKSFADANSLQQHIKRFHLSKTSSKTYSCHLCGKTYNNQAAVRTHMIKHINKKFTCDQCPSTFSSPYTLAQHRKRHDGTEEPQHCETCNITYTTRKSLLAHFRNALCHQVTVLVCPICSRTCANQRSLTTHIQTVHTTEKPYSCEECPARYSSHKSYSRHRREHRGRAERRVCHRCGAGFRGNSKLNRHLRNVCEKNKADEDPSAFYNQELQ